MRKAYVRIKLPEEVTDYVTYIATNRILGYRSMIEFVANATRKEIQYLRRLGFIPPTVPRVRTVSPGAIGVLSVLAVAITAIAAVVTPATTGLTTGLHAIENMATTPLTLVALVIGVSVLLLSVALSTRWYGIKYASVTALTTLAAVLTAAFLLPTDWLVVLLALTTLLLSMLVAYPSAE